MARSARRIAAGFSQTQAREMAGGSNVATALTAAGTEQADALAITADVNVFGTVASGTGARLPAYNNAGDLDDEMQVVNGGANALLVYPPTGGKINNLSTNAGYSLAAAKGCTFIRVSSTLWVTSGA